MNLKRDRRKDKNYTNYMRRKLKFGMYVVDCRYHPCRITKFCRDTMGDDFDVISLFDGSGSCCSVKYCGPEPISKSEAEEMVAYRKDHGFYDYLKKYQGYTDEGIEEFKALDKAWNFNKG